MEHIFLTNEQNSKDEYIKIINETASAITKAFNSSSAYSGPTPQELKKIVHQNSILPEKGLGWEKVLNLTKEKILPNLLRTSSTDYMPHLHSPALLESIAAELIIATFNQSMDSWDQAPVATEIELEVVKHLCNLFGFNKNADGVFTSGGSQSNETAIIIALNWFVSHILNFNMKKYGLPENFSKLRMYTSEISHFSMEKTAQIIGLGTNCVVKVPVDSKKKIDFSALKNLIEKDIAEGNIPFLVVATIGTTDFGSIDPYEQIAELCKKYNIWLHADAAYGSGVILSEKYAEKVKNLNVCNSITVDFHKMFLLPISCSALLVKNSEDFNALTIHADYLNRTEDEEDGYTNLVDKSLQTTRRFDALKVWIAFQTRGKDGWNKIITKNLDNAKYLYSIIKENKNFVAITEPEISSVVFRHVSSDEVNKQIRRKLLHEHGIVIGQTVSDGKVCLKFTLLNPLMTHEKLEQLVLLIEKIAERNYGRTITSLQAT